MSFEHILGQERAKKILQNGLRSGKVSHAYLFSGPKGTGKLGAAFTFTKALFCERLQDDACDECLSCRKIEHGNHPDVQVISPEGQSIKIDQIRELQREFSYRTHAAGRKVYIIEQAESMTVQAANSLLKFLEEPTSPITAILITENGQAMLPTIQSRSQGVPFTPQDPQIICSELIKQGCPAALARAAVHVVNGLDAGIQLCQQNWFAELRNVMLQLGKECGTRLSSALLMAQQKVFKTELAEHADMLFRLFHLWFRDMLNYQYNRQDSLVFRDQLDAIGKLAWTKSAEGWIRCMDAATEAQKRVRANVSSQLAFEQFLVGMQGGT
ncbi:DNA polymerase III subunit delta' [Paenibacillus profundus]|uniref:DNA polymerase III subunit delta n=1 Tax=Paenibacillus profundus TaxID=1173085 RepID=A0ABS8YS32_9BACL|nr:DNA polymerase III subunit delta' [Paenibacillus profundus]MCE5172434.1 DNA polymerase III subunit delta' [Paenibacillus profundus]